MRIVKSNTESGLTMVEVMVILVVVILLIGFFAPSFTSDRRKARQISCLNNLKQTGLSFRMWSEDHDHLYPMRYRTNDFDGPSLGNGQQMHHWFQVMSNELSTPKIVICPSDDKNYATNFTRDF